MNSVFKSLCLIFIIIFGPAFYSVKQRFHEQDTTADLMTKRIRVSQQNASSVSVSSGQQSAPTDKSPCDCCREKLERAKERARQRRKANEIWARKMIDYYGYEKGMKQVAGRSQMLAKRMQRILEESKDNSVLVPSQVTQ